MRNGPKPLCAYIGAGAFECMGQQDDTGQVSGFDKKVAVADVFDALTSLRDYPKHDESGKSLGYDQLPISQAVTILEKESGSHFDAAVVAALKKCLPDLEIQG